MFGLGCANFASSVLLADFDNLFGLHRAYVEGQAELTPGTHQVRLEFDYDGGGLGKGATL